MKSSTYYQISLKKTHAPKNLIHPSLFYQISLNFHFLKNGSDRKSMRWWGLYFLLVGFFSLASHFLYICRNSGSLTQIHQLLSPPLYDNHAHFCLHASYEELMGIIQIAMVSWEETLPDLIETPGCSNIGRWSRVGSQLSSRSSKSLGSPVLFTLFLGSLSNLTTFWMV